MVLPGVHTSVCEPYEICTINRELQLTEDVALLGVHTSVCEPYKIRTINRELQLTEDGVSVVKK